MTNHLYLIRGASGSGKSTFAAKIGCPVIEADMFFETDEGYKYDPSRIKQAHAWCQDRAWDLLKSGKDVAVSNTFTKLWGLEAYLQMAKILQVQVTIVRCVNRFQNTHNVPDEVVQRMWDNYESSGNETVWQTL